MSHRSQGPWRYEGKRAVARRIMARYQFVNRPPTPEEEQALKEKYGAVQIRIDGRPVPLAELAGRRRREARAVVAVHLHMLRYWSRFDSMAAPSIMERLTQSWEWRQRT